MPDWLAIDTSGNRDVTNGGKLIKNVPTAKDAVALLLADRGAYAYEQQFTVFKKADGTKINVEQARTVTELAADGVTVIDIYDEGELEALKATYPQT